MLPVLRTRMFMVFIIVKNENSSEVQECLRKVLHALYMFEYVIDSLLINLSLQRYTLQQLVKPILS